MNKIHRIKCGNGSGRPTNRFFKLFIAVFLTLSAAACAAGVPAEPAPPNSAEPSVPAETAPPQPQFYISGEQPAEPFEFTDEDQALQAFLTETAPEAYVYYHLYTSGFVRGLPFPAESDGEHESVITVTFPWGDGFSAEYALLSEELPQTVPSLETALKKIFSEKAVSEYMQNVEKAESEKIGECEYAVTVSKDCAPLLLELNGRMYRIDGSRGGFLSPEWTTAKIVEQTETEIVFVYLGFAMSDTEMLAGLGRLKNEEGWKFDGFDFGESIETVDYREYYPNLP